MQTRSVITRHCPVAGRNVQVEEIHLVEGTSTCQIETQLIHRRCLDDTICPGKSDCPLHLEYEG